MFTDSEKTLIKFLKKYGWLLFMTIMFYFITFAYWDKFLSNGAVSDGKHGITFISENAYGHLAFATIGSLFFSYFLIKSIIKFKDSN